MIVLEGSGKSLLLSAKSASASTILQIVTSYWSIDTSDNWTIHSHEIELSGGTTGNALALAGPSGSEVARVVENIYIACNRDLTQLELALFPGPKNIFFYLLAIPLGSQFILKRDGSITWRKPTTPLPT